MIVDSKIAQIASEIVEKSIKDISEVIADQQLSDRQKLMQEANIFLQGMAEAERITKALETEYKMLQSWRHQLKSINGDITDMGTKTQYNQKNTQFWVEFKQVQGILKNMYSLVFKFQEGLNDILNQKVQMVYTVGGRNLGAYEISSENHLDYLSLGFSKDGNLVGRYQILQRQLDSMQSINEKLKQEQKLNFSGEGLDNTYKEVLWRYNRARQKIKNNHADRGLYVILWKIRNQWDGMKVTSRGDLAEAYSSYLIKNHKYPSFSSGIEFNVRDFMTNASVDSTSGVLVGDVRAKARNETDKNIEYAIKTAGASALSIQQFKNLALKIQQGLITSKSSLQIEQKRMINAAEGTEHFRKATAEEIQAGVDKLENSIETHVAKLFN